MRNTGIDIIGSVPWGTHFCQFYQDKQDLIEILVPYFAAGLQQNEFCMWATCEPLSVEEAQAALYTAGGTFEANRVLHGWVGRLYLQPGQVRCT
ncbi:MAG: MEDS domain-containing protein [Bacillota bacterium]|nr:MEDS domain-containing protein [Bacillota bacterium]